jgi:hypothetical protein
MGKKGMRWCDLNKNDLNQVLLAAKRDMSTNSKNKKRYQQALGAVNKVRNGVQQPAV